MTSSRKSSARTVTARRNGRAPSVTVKPVPRADARPLSAALDSFVSTLGLPELRVRNVGVNDLNQVTGTLEAASREDFDQWSEELIGARPIGGLDRWWVGPVAWRVVTAWVPDINASGEPGAWPVSLWCLDASVERAEADTLAFPELSFSMPAGLVPAEMIEAIAPGARVSLVKAPKTSAENEEAAAEPTGPAS